VSNRQNDKLKPEIKTSVTSETTNEHIGQCAKVLVLKT